jgi:hypothetical protein
VRLNQARAKLLKPEQALRGYPWSSWPESLRAAGKRPQRLCVEQVLEKMSIAQDSAAGRRELELVMEGRRGAERGGARGRLQTDSAGLVFFGDRGLKQELLGQMSRRMGPEHYGEERQGCQVEKAERVVAEELRRRRWTMATLGERKRGDPEKVRMAVRSRRCDDSMDCEAIANEKRGKREHVSIPVARGETETSRS